MAIISKNRLAWGVLCLLMLIGCGIGFKEHTIEEVTQALYDEGLICSKELGHVEYPSGLHVHPFKDTLCFSKRYRDLHGRVELYPTRREQRRVIQDIAEEMRDFSSYSELVKGNVVIRIFPELTEEDAERFRRALDTLE